MSLAQRMHFLQDVFKMTAIALISVISHYHINGMPLFFNHPVYDPDHVILCQKVDDTAWFKFYFLD